MNTFCAEVIEPEVPTTDKPVNDVPNLNEANEVIRRIAEAGSSEKEEPKLPPMYACVLHNDPVTPYQFVVEVLNQIFGLELQRADALMRAVHRGTRGVIVIVSKEQAETYLARVTAANQAVRQNLQVTMESETEAPK